MRLAIMQPYFLPYLGYYQLMAAADKFVVYDDVNFIKGGWINRNRILLCGRAHFITAPMEAASSNRHINELRLAPSSRWREIMLKTIEQAYPAAPQFAAVFPLLRTVIDYSENDLAKYLFHSLVRLKEYLKLPTELIASSGRYGNESLRGEERVLDICRQEKADVYINAQGGRSLYSGRAFSDHEVTLRFLEAGEIGYSQGGPEFCPSLSIVDTLMFNSSVEIQSLLSRHRLCP